jgi:hypothetical protein
MLFIIIHEGFMVLRGLLRRIPFVTYHHTKKNQVRHHSKPVLTHLIYFKYA